MASAGWLVLGWVVLYFLAYTMLGVSGYVWYYAPLVPGFVLLVAWGAQAITGGLKRITPPSIHRGALAVGFVALTMPQWFTLLATPKQPDVRGPIYRAIGTWLRDNTPTDASVGMLEVGIIGYHAQRKVIDFAGLIQPAVTQQVTRQTTYEQMAQWATEHYHPNYIVLHEGFAPQLQRTYIAQQCQLAQSFAGKDFGYSANMNVFVCRK
jgi:hypothetical protein